MNRWARTRQGDQEQAYAEISPAAEPVDDSHLPRTSPEQWPSEAAAVAGALTEEQEEVPRPLAPERLVPSKLSSSQHTSRGDEAMSDAEAAMADGDYARAAAFSQFATAHYAAATAKRKWR